MLRLLADDLTGALDSAAPFAAVRGALPVIWTETGFHPDDRDLAFDSGTRDAEAGQAAARVTALAPLLRGADPAFKKIDSRLRGHPAAEIAAATRAGGFRTTVVTGAFPAQGRIMRDGRQWVREGEGWRDVGVDLRAELAELGLKVGREPAAGKGVVVCDAVDDDELLRIVEAGRGLEPPVLWCGTGGLARARSGPGRALPAAEVVAPPVLVLIGTGHAATMAQLAALGRAESAGLRVARMTLPPGSPAAAARQALEALVGSVATVPAPATLIVAGGETLMCLCRELGTERLSVEGEIEPGVPVSHMVGGRWPGLGVVSKSGGFGDPRLLRRLLAPILGGAGHG